MRPARPADAADDDTVIAAFGRLIVTHRYLERVVGRQLEETTGLSLTWLEVLLRLSHAPSAEMSMGELARRMQLTSGGATRVVDRLIAAGEVQRRAAAHDRRVQFVTLTPAGRTRARAAAEAHARTLREIFAPLSGEQLATLVDLLDRLRAADAPSPGHG